MLSMDLLAERAKNFGHTRRKGTDGANVNEGLDICDDSGPVQLLLDNVGGRSPL